MDIDEMNDDRRRLMTAAIAVGTASALGMSAAQSANSGDSAKGGASAPGGAAPVLLSEYAFTITLGDLYWVKPTNQGSTRATR
jgi:hypothetical protein